MQWPHSAPSLLLFPSFYPFMCIVKTWHTHRQKDKQTQKVKTEVPLTSSTDVLVQYYTMQPTLHISCLTLSQIKGQSLLVGNLVSTDHSLLWQEQSVSRFTQLRKEYDKSVYSKHLNSKCVFDDTYSAEGLVVTIVGRYV